MQQAGVIQPLKSPWASPVVLVIKKDGSHSFCVDYWMQILARYLLYRWSVGPVSFLSIFLHTRSGCRLLANQYPESRPKTAFVAHETLHEFTVMLFELTNAQAAFQRVMQQVVMDLNTADAHTFVSVHIDDVLIISRTLEEHLEHLERVLRRLIEVGLKLKLQKCHFIHQEVGFLGYVICNPSWFEDQWAAHPCCLEFPVPNSVRAVRQFMCLCSYYPRILWRDLQVLFRPFIP